MRFTKYLLASFLFLFSSSIFADHPEYSLLNDQWRIITLPAQPPENSNTVESIFGDDFTRAGINPAATYQKQWILYAYTPNGYKKLQYRDILEQDKGYWIIQLTGKSVTLNMPADSIDTPEEHSIQLASAQGGNHEQWNLIGQPFPKQKRLSDFSVHNSSGVCSNPACDINQAEAEKLVHNKVWIYNGNSYSSIDQNGMLPPWGGFWAATLENSYGQSLTLKHNSVPDNHFEIGANLDGVKPTLKAGPGRLFAAPDGAGENCNEDLPCSIQVAFGKLKAGSVLFLKGERFVLPEPLAVNSWNTGTKENPVIIETYPEQEHLAIIDGQGTGKGLAMYGTEYVSFRRLEITGMADHAIYIRNSKSKNKESKHNTVEGCHVHDNQAVGIHLDDSSIYTANPYRQSNNVVRHNRVHDNFGGGNSDGISITAGTNNTIVHNTVYSNSDDGIDTWRSDNSYVAFNRVYENGIGRTEKECRSGECNGIKAGGNIDENAPHGKSAIVEHNISYDNRGSGFHFNYGKNVTFRYNTSYENEQYGYMSSADAGINDDTLIQYNIASGKGKVTIDQDQPNSWQRDGKPDFISLDRESNDFLRPQAGGVFGGMGAYATQGR